MSKNFTPPNTYDYAVFMGRFQPFHNGHMKILIEAYKIAKEVIIVMGSANRPRTIKNPFTADERKEMISCALDSLQFERTHFIAQEDYFYSDTQWIEDVQKKVHAITWRKFTPDPIKICLIGHKKDHTSYYLDLFPQWDSVDVENSANINATNIRKNMFNGLQKDIAQTSDKNGLFPAWGWALTDNVPLQTQLYLSQLRQNNVEEFSSLVKEYQFIQKYKKQWENAPYPPTFVTCDATVIQSGHVLMVKRRAEPGKGLWAVPGGFLNLNEKIEDGILRELKEETKIDVPLKVLKGSIKTIRVFDHPERSLRGRTITHNALIRLPNGPLPKIRGGDDAEKAKWVPLSDIKCELMFDDHFDMIQIMKMIGE